MSINLLKKKQKTETYSLPFEIFIIQFFENLEIQKSDVIPLPTTSLDDNASGEKIVECSEISSS